MKNATLAQGNEVLNLILRKEVSSTKVQNLLETGILSDLLEAEDLRKVNRDVIRIAVGLHKLAPKIIELDTLTLPEQDVSLTERIDAGEYNFMYSTCRLTPENFPITLGAVKRSLVLAHFGYPIAKDSVKKWADNNGYALAKTEDLLAVGSHPRYRYLQGKFPIVCLDNFRSLYLDLDDFDGRSLIQSQRICEWDEPCRFLLVRKEAA